MPPLIVYASRHHGNTEKVARAMGEAVGAEAVKTADCDPARAAEADLLGVGSGIYFARLHRSLVTWIERLPEGGGRPAFVFATSGVRSMPIGNAFKKRLRGPLEARGYRVIDTFDCRGYTNYGPFKLIGGIARGRPNEADLERARGFARRMVEG